MYRPCILDRHHGSQGFGSTTMSVFMKKIVASVGLVALGVSTASAAYAPGLSPMDTSKAWSIGASLRGFYDDNYNGWNSDNPTVEPRDSFGFEISPFVRFNLPLEQTYLGIRYIYSARYFEDRASMGDNDPWDQTHQVDLVLNHAFSERYTLDVQDSFVIAQEPELLAPMYGSVAYPYRTQGDNVHNFASAMLHAELTRQVGLLIGYRNALWDYENSFNNQPYYAGFPTISPSLSGLMDRMEHSVPLDLRWLVVPQTTAILGYTFGATTYSSTELIGFLPTVGFFDSSIRDLYSHSIYAGIEHNFLRDITVSIRAGATYLDYLHNEANSDDWIPYFDGSLSYGYAPGSNVRVGLMYTYNTTDQIAPDYAAGTVTSSQYSTSAYAALTHRLTAKLLGSASVMYQHSMYHGGYWDEQADDFLMLGLNLTYAINPHWSAEVGYDYDLLSSDVPYREYDRNRVYLGVTASF